MDFLEREFIAFARHLREELRIVKRVLVVIRDDIQKQTEAAQEARNAVPVLRAELQVPHTIEVETHPKNKKTGRERYKLVVETLTLLGVLAYAAIAAFQLCEMKKATVATQKSADATTTALHLDQRAWVMPSNAPPKLVMNAVINVPFKIVNTGKTPALDFSGSVIVNVLPEGKVPEFVYTRNTGHSHYKLFGPTFFPGSPVIYNFPATDPNMNQGTELTVHPISVFLTKQLRADLESGKYWIAVHGELTYKDVVGCLPFRHFLRRWARKNSRGRGPHGLRCSQLD